MLLLQLRLLFLYLLLCLRLFLRGPGQERHVLLRLRSAQA